MLIPNKFNGYSRDGRRLYHFGGGGGGTTQSTGTTYTTNIPEYAEPYVHTMLGATQKQLFKMNDQGEITDFRPYKPYSTDPSSYVAPFSPMQQQAFEGIKQLGPSGQLGTATSTAQDVASRAMGASYDPAQTSYMQAQAPQLQQFQMGPADRVYGGQYNAPSMVAAQTDFSPGLQQFQMGPAERVRADMFGGQQAAQYMSPFIEQAMEPQLREARRASEMQRTADQAQATRAGAFGGSRQAIVEAERQRNLGTQMGDIRARGLQTAYEQATQQFNQDAARRLQAQQLNQQAGLTVGGQNLQALLNTQQLGTQTGLQTALANLSSEQQANVQNQAAQLQAQGLTAGQAMQAALANQQAGLTVGGQNLQALLGTQQLGAGQNLQAQLANQQAYQAAQQLGEQSRQYGAGFGMQGLQTALQGAGQLGALGQQEFGQRQAALGMQQQVGTQQQALEQQKINQAIQDFANAQQYPLMQLGTMSNMLRGLPMQAQTTNQYVAAPNPITQGIGLAGAGASIYNAMRPPGGAAGGLPSEFKYAEGGIASVPRYDVGGEVYSDLTDMSADQLKNIIKESSSQRIKEMAKGILAEKTAQRMYGGGIVAFQRGGDAIDPESEVSVPQSPVSIKPGQRIPRSRANFPYTGINDPITDEENAQAEALERFDRQMLEQDRLRGKALHERFMAAERAKSPEERAAEQQAAFEARDKQEAANRANFIESIRQEYGDEAAKEAAATGVYFPQMRAYSPVRAVDSPSENIPAGIMEASPRAAAQPAAPAAPAQPALTGRTSTAEGRAGEAEAQGAGLASVPPPRVAPSAAAAAEDRAGEAEARAGTAPVTAEPTFTGTLADAQRAEYEARTRANRPVSAFLEDIETGKPENTAAAEYRKQVMAERANAKDEAERQRHMRLAQFFAKWGSTPGPTIAAGLNALEKTIPDLISDEKEQKKAKRELDKISFDIDNSIRLEKLGDMKEARALKEKAADRAMSLQERLMTAQQNEEESKRRLEGTKYTADRSFDAAKARERGAGLDRTESRKSREAREAEVRWQASRGQLETVNSNIAREQASTQYMDAKRKIQTAESAPGVKDAQGNIDESKIPEGLRASYDAAKKLIEVKDTEFETRRRNAQNVVNRYAKEVGVDVEDSGPAAKTMTRADVAETARVSGKTVAEVEAAAKARGITIK